MHSQQIMQIILSILASQHPDTGRQAILVPFTNKHQHQTRPQLPKTGGIRAPYFYPLGKTKTQLPACILAQHKDVVRIKPRKQCHVVLAVWDADDMLHGQVTKERGRVRVGVVAPLGSGVWLAEVLSGATSRSPDWAASRIRCGAFAQHSPTGIGLHLSAVGTQLDMIRRNLKATAPIFAGTDVIGMFAKEFVGTIIR